jgi:molybdopterin molybdotransferase
MRAIWSWRYGIEPLDLNEAVDRIVSSITPLQIEESVNLARADNRIAAATIRAEVDLPPFPSSAMDGIAVNVNTLVGSPPYSLRMVGESRAGHPFTAPGVLQPNDCVRIFTGAPLPTGLNTVVIQEDCEFLDTDPFPTVTLQAPGNTGDNVRDIGHDIAAGAQIVAAGTRLDSFAVGWLGACGLTEAAVIKRPTVSIFSTGDELREPGSQLGPGQIFDANRILLSNMLSKLPVEVVDLGILPDNPDTIHQALVTAANSSDMLITSAGVSVGDADFVTETLQRIGSLEVWRLLIKPGKPLAFGRINDCLFFGLPGNPVSTVVTFLTVARSAILQLCGATAVEQLEYAATLADAIYHKPGREEFQRGRLTGSGANMSVHTTGDQSSNRLASFHGANCLIRVPKSAGNLQPGIRVNVIPFSGVLT